MDLILATYPGSPEPSPSDQLLAAALEARGARVSSRPWDAIDPGARSGELVCLRSTWDYHLRMEEFRAWVTGFRHAPGRLWNPPETVLWNLDKEYLGGLERLGVAVPATRWLPVGAEPDLASLFRETGWHQAVLKPRISASAHGTILVTPERVLSPQEAASLSASGAMLQEFLPEIRTRGEVSLMFFGGEYSHAVCKEVAAGEFRVQSELGGGARVLEASPELRAFGARVLASASQPCLYARVDLVETTRGPLLMELELVEPELFFNLAPARADHLAERLIFLATQNSRR